jgi:lysyl-tRNA synthetase class 2
VDDAPRAPQDDLPEQVRVRREKVERLRAAGTPPYAVGAPRTASLAEVRARHADLAVDTASGEVVSVTGRVVLSRVGGKLCFATLQEADASLQVMVSLDGVGEQRLADWKADVDLGDHVGVTGEVISSRRGELSVLASEWLLTSKALRPLPDKHHGLTDPELRIRQRYRRPRREPDSRRMVHDRPRSCARPRRAARPRLRRGGDAGAADGPRRRGGRPFATHLNALDLDMTLRIALELYLKRLVVGGVDRSSRSAASSATRASTPRHSPEFTMLEFYEAYGDYDTVADSTREMVLEAARRTGRTVVPDGQGGEVDLEQPWRTRHAARAGPRRSGDRSTPGTPLERVVALAATHDVALQDDWDAGEVVLELYEKLVEHTLLQPTFVRDYPVSARPLARDHRDDPRLAEAWDLVIAGTELATGYSELVDPVEQRRRLTAQSVKAAGGDPDAMQLDEDFLRALEHGAPPMGGQGMGIDRLVMLLTGAPIRETILFPLVRPLG